MSITRTAKRMAGGSAAERGLDFQARVSAIVLTHILAERSVGWLEGVLDDTPLELDAETGGPGDDVRFGLRDGKEVELQAKRGLQRGDDLWDALINLSKGISAGRIDAGVLAICPNSSGTIREALAEDIVRLGTGRTDGLREIGQDWANRLSVASLDATVVCSHLRIVVVSAIEGNREAESTAIERLNRVVQDPQAAWRVLVDCGRLLIRRRGRATPENIYRDFSLAHVALKTSDIDTRIQFIAATREWLHSTHANMTLLGVRNAVPIDACWLPVDAQVLEEALAEPEELDKALRRYHDYGRRHGVQSFDSQTTARFVKKCVVMGGPGMGKSTLLKKLALEYSIDGFLTLLVRLPQVAALITREGRRFEDSLLEVALSASGIPAPLMSLEGAVILCDALDECGSQQPLITSALHAFSVAHPRSRVVVTSRPIGYRPGELAEWRHYELQPLNDSVAEQAVLQVLKAIPFTDESMRTRAVELAKGHFHSQSLKGAASRSPLMITLIAALSAKGVDPSLGKASLYRQLFQLLEDHPPPRLAYTPPSEPERGRFLEMLGWCLLSHGNEAAQETLSRCSRWWCEETGRSHLVSEAQVVACLEYWECLGVVERVRTLAQEAITFVHKTFGEFAAGRYISKCPTEMQRDIVARAIRVPEWKEALSFASHLGLASLIMQVWAELAEHGDTNAGYGLDDAVELVVQAGVPITNDALAGFAQCCWDAVENNASRVRYAAGEALCLVSLDHWSVVRETALARLESPDSWNRLVAWTCLCLSPEKELTGAELVNFLRSSDHAQPTEYYLGGMYLSPTGGEVRQHLICGAARRILNDSPEPEWLQTLNDLIGDGGGLSLNSYRELSSLYKQAGLKLITRLDDMWSRSMDQLMPKRSDWNSEAICLLELIDDPSVASDDSNYDDLSRSFELGALLSATSFWRMSSGSALQMSAPESEAAGRRMVIHAVARSTGLNHARLVREARAMKKIILADKEHEEIPLFCLPKVDAIADCDQVLTGQEFGPALESLILGESELFATNAAQLLYGLREQPEYTSAIERLLTCGRGASLRISGALANAIPNGAGQQLILERLCRGDSTSGCRYLYHRLAPPFDARHLEAVQKGLEGTSDQAARAAAELANRLPLDDVSVRKWRSYFDEWRTKEKPYPKVSGGIPDSPRDGLAKVLAPAFAQDHAFLLELLTDDRPDVRNAAWEPVMSAASASASLRARLLEDVQSGRLDQVFFRAAVSNGLYLGDEAELVVRLFYHDTARVRYAALPILNVKFLPPQLVQAEGSRLLADAAIDIREGASRALRTLTAVNLVSSQL